MEQTFLTTFAYAKINLALAVQNIREDGYHELQSVMQTVELHDIVKVRRQGKEIVCRCGNLSGPGNLAYKAADLYLKHCGLTEGMEIEIVKHIPLQAGLAGGSSDAAATLRAANRLYGNLLGQAELLKLAGQCGADVAFCLQGGTMWATGRGERLESLPAVPEMDLVLVKPSAGVDTKEAYCRFDLLGQGGSLVKSNWERTLSKGSSQDIAGLLYNDLEAASQQIVPQILELKHLFEEEECYGSLMTGSGSCVFGIAREKQHAQKVADRLRRKGFTNVWVTKTVAKVEDRKERESWENV